LLHPIQHVAPSGRRTIDGDGNAFGLYYDLVRLLNACFSLKIGYFWHIGQAPPQAGALLATAMQTDRPVQPTLGLNFALRL
jgi:hypothetical protein